MVKKGLFFYAAGFLLAIITTSCATVYPNEKLIVGKWRPVHAEEYIEMKANNTSSKPAVKQTEKNTVVVQNTETVTTGAQAHSGDKMNRMIQTELQSPMVIYANKTAEKTFPNRTVTVTWKMKKKGTRVIATNEQTSRQLKLDILSVSDSTLVVVERSDEGNIKVKYIKDQK